MPELPEVETVVREIRPQIGGKTVAAVSIEIPRQLVGMTPRTLGKKIVNSKIVDVTRRGKYIVIRLDVGTLLIHLRMSGRLYVRSTHTLPESHERALFRLKGVEKILVLRDVRSLGTLHFFEVGKPIVPLLQMGWEPLEDRVSPRELSDALLLRKSAIKPVLLDQKLWAGIGNIYASETLWVAKIHPERRANTLTISECKRLIKAVVDVLERALNKGGSTLRDFMSPDGNVGEYSGEFRVYDRVDEPCYRCRKKILRIVQAQRSTFYCPACQRL